jgi:hypothetical protein
VPGLESSFEKGKTVDLHELAKEVKQLQPTEMICSISSACAFFVPGSLMLLCFREDLLRELPVFLCLVLAIALSAPLCFLNALLMLPVVDLVNSSKAGYHFTSTAVVVHLVACPVLLLIELFDWSFATFTVLLLMWQIMVTLACHHILNEVKNNPRQSAN